MSQKRYYCLLACFFKLKIVYKNLLNLCRHLKRRHPETYQSYEHQRDGKSADQNQRSMASFVLRPDEKCYSSTNPRQKLLVNSLVSNLIIACGLPVSIVDHPNLRRFFHDVDPKFVVPCRQTVSNTILPTLQKNAQQKLERVLESSEHVALTTDIWTDRRAHAFLGVTVHAFQTGQAISRLLAFQSFHGSHTGQKIADALESVITENHLQTKVRSVVTDNATNMVKAMSVLFTADDNDITHLDDNADPSLWEDMESVDVDAMLNNLGLPVRMSCFAHSLQLVIRDGLSSTAVVRTALAKCCKLANLVHQSPLFRSAFEAELGTGRAIPVMNDTR